MPETYNEIFLAGPEGRQSKKNIFPKHTCLGSPMWSPPNSAGTFSLTPPSPGTAERTQRRSGEVGRLYCSPDQPIGHISEHLYNDDQSTDSVEAWWLQVHTEPPDNKIPWGWWYSSSQTSRLYLDVLYFCPAHSWTMLQQWTLLYKDMSVLLENSLGG